MPLGPAITLAPPVVLHPSRAIRFHATCGLLFRGGPQAKEFVEKRAELACGIMIAIISAGVVATRYVL